MLSRKRLGQVVPIEKKNSIMLNYSKKKTDSGYVLNKEYLFFVRA